ncbi:hypothetical protein KP78_08370 [Jeotgalibacillus soli]|uniref:Uncharacterized protein n=1 Tax=Jeotgalibacillus soli TaxID=889306 RepID=A0A0C2S5Q1_9BACL|nr:hypothetical protein KP78_08370 [Jeotgalibacillus soli]
MWNNIVTLRNKYRFEHWRIYNKLYYSYLTRIRGYKKVVFDKEIKN